MPVVYTKDKQIDGYGKSRPISESIKIILIAEDNSINSLDGTIHYTLCKGKNVVDSFHYRLLRTVILNYIKSLKIEIKRIDIYDKTGFFLLRSYDKNFKRIPTLVELLNGLENFFKNEEKGCV